MITSRAKCQTLATLFAVSFLSTVVFAGPVISYDPQTSAVRLVEKNEVGSKVTSQFRVKAKGTQEVSQAYGSVAGVLFQATAQPSRPIKNGSIELAYRLDGNHDAILVATIGQNEVTSEVPAWVWAVAARFANHDCTGAVTLLDRPQSVSEKIFERRWRVENGTRGRLLWVRYHPAVDDTLIGFFLLTADAMLADPEKLRTMTDGLVDFDKYSGYSMMTRDGKRKSQAAYALNAIIKLKSRPGDYAMLNDLDSGFRFEAVNGKLNVSGVPSYHFAREVQGGIFRAAHQLNVASAENRHLFHDINPLVNKTVADFSRLVAFFNYVAETDPEELDAFVQSLGPVFDRIPTLETPIAVPLANPPRRGGQ
ncbi:MAG TPA: hypothetical protein EYQ75_05800 [Planctomycetaceae bacterium]|nr:hypothetical protein [Planctomycetaceae bacterium]